MTVPAIVDIAPHTPESKYSAVFLDFGGVLSPPIEDLFAEYERKTGIAPSDLKAAMAGVATASASTCWPRSSWGCSPSRSGCKGCTPG